MYPELFKIGPIAVYSYGAMLACAFIVGAWLFRRELRRWNLPEDLADRVALAAMFGDVRRNHWRQTVLRRAGSAG